MSDELKTVRFQMLMSPKLAQLIEDWGFENRIRTRAEAMRRLCEIGLAAHEQSFKPSTNKE